MKEPPKGWPRISASVFYEEPKKAIEFLCKAFGFEVRLEVEGEGGRIEHSELTFHGGLVMVGTAESSAHGPRNGRAWCASPRATGGKVTQALCVAVDDADAHAARARAAGAIIAMEPTTTDYGDDYWADRTYEAIDPEGHHWWFMQRVRNPGERGEG
ncbi:MAG: VOC family protein [Labilithrix sp.]|nr:VOC family protein [Labilithrix sp.]